MTNPFDAEIVFSGLCNYIPSPSWEAPERLYVLMMNAGGRGGAVPVLRFPSPSDGDATYPSRHASFIRFGLRELLRGGAFGIDDVGVFYLRGVSVDFDFEEAEDGEIGRNDLSVNWKPRADTEESLQWLPLMSEIFRPDAPAPRIDPNLIVAPDAARVAAKVDIRRGLVVSHGLREQKWAIPVVGDAVTMTRKLAHSVMLRLRNLKSFCIRVSPFDGGPRTTIDLLPADGRLRLEIVNGCDVNPLGWERMPAPEKDWDFLWNFEVLSPDVLDWMLSSGCVSCVPAPVTEGGGQPDGLNCFGTGNPGYP